MPEDSPTNNLAHDAGLTSRTPSPQLVPAIAAAVIRVNGSRAIKDVDLATLMGIGLPELYKRIGDRLWRFTPKLYCKLSGRYDRGQTNTQPRLAFFHGGVIALAGMIGDGTLIQIGLNVAHVLKNYRRKSRRKPRSARRAGDPVRFDRYHQARVRLYDVVGPYLSSRHA